MSPPRDQDSDSDDEDYVPPADEESDNSEEGNITAQDDAQPVTKDELAEQQRARAALWESFQASVTAPAKVPDDPAPKKTVKIEKRYLFAGKHITEVVDVEEDSEDAKKWPLWMPPEHSDAPESAQTASNANPKTCTSASTSSIDPQGDSSKLVRPTKRPGPRRPRTTLAAIPTPATQKAKKLTTLDKSAMDWRSHVTSQPNDVKDELDANRRSGGYLEKVEFLQRVDERREDVLDTSKSNKRRRTQL
ncbi:bucentaur or craniofacial development-domain-containing protein [Hygrophoropsis aurantiaca]|uniref:Bucentaur or craniofacial development-domain-containing protein n=1 Tax=Hygrophoropsis aurantiaca TaxID=72124 RepID=A0ACB8AB26_9AGAM|nr:bucentaur or craniofacial development-domain-containing protein [Hygrophoropsis aurantiaca]